MRTNLQKAPLVGISLVASGLAINYLLERYNILKLWENSSYPISLADIVYPPVCVLLSVAGIVLLIDAKLSIRPHAFLYAFALALSLTVLYAVFAFGMQFIQTGADRLGECPGLDAAAASSGVIPDSKSRPGHAAVGCAVERRGIFLSYYNDIEIFGVTERASQQRVLGALREHYRNTHTHPVQVRFFDEQNWTVEHGKNGVTFGHSGPQKLLRVTTIG